MALAVFEYCFNEDIPVFYVDGIQLNWLYQAEQDFSDIKIEKSLNIKMYLQSHGAAYKLGTMLKEMGGLSAQGIVASYRNC